MTSLGEIVETGGCFNLWLPYNDVQGKEAAIAIHNKVSEVGTAGKVDLSSTNGFDAAILDSSDNIVSTLTFGTPIESQEDYFERTVKIFFKSAGIDGEIEGRVGYQRIEGDRYSIVHGSFIHGGLGDLSFRSSKNNESLRFYSSNRDLVQNHPDLKDVVKSILDNIKGTLINPYQVIYGNASEGDILREVLGENIVVGDRGELFRLQDKRKACNLSGSGSVTLGDIVVTPLNRAEELKKAEALLRENVWQNYIAGHYKDALVVRLAKALKIK